MSSRLKSWLVADLCRQVPDSAGDKAWAAGAAACRDAGDTAFFFEVAANSGGIGRSIAASTGLCAGVQGWGGRWGAGGGGCTDTSAVAACQRARTLKYGWCADVDVDDNNTGNGNNSNSVIIVKSVRRPSNNSNTVMIIKAIGHSLHASNQKCRPPIANVKRNWNWNTASGSAVADHTGLIQVPVWNYETINDTPLAHFVTSCCPQEAWPRFQYGRVMVDKGSGSNMYACGGPIDVCNFQIPSGPQVKR